MWWNSLWRCISVGSKARSERRRARGQTRSFRPCLESLEQRLAPAAVSTLASLVPFPYGTNPQAGLVRDSSGNLFGTTVYGGASNEGTVYELSPTGGGGYTITTLVSFNRTNGANPQANLILDGSGNLFGTTYNGGASSGGTAFELSPAGGGGYTLTTLVDFNGTNGIHPQASLLRDSSGNLFGTTAGDASNQGTVFRLSPASGNVYNLTTLLSFTGGNGAAPRASLVQDSSGNLFGTTSLAGPLNNGTVFKLSRNGGGGYTLTTLYAFDGTHGGAPQSALLLDTTGHLFGTAGDRVFELSPAGGGYNYTTLAIFDGTNGLYSYAGLIEDGAGNLFGTTTGSFLTFPPTYWPGFVFELSPAGGGNYTLTTLSSFGQFEAHHPEASLLLDGAGNLFGTTYDGGISNGGGVFELSPAGGGSYNRTTVATFDEFNGTAPQAGLVRDSSGNLFGTAAYGGPSAVGIFPGDGTVFKLTPAAGGGYDLTNLVLFNGTNGANPFGGLVMDGSGNLFGTTSGGGTSDDGTLFELSPAGGGAYNLTTLVNFTGTNGANPHAGLIMDGSGNLFGTTQGGGTAGGYGTVFELSPTGGGGYNLVTLVSFNSTNGAQPAGGLVEDSAGNLFGTTLAGGPANLGTVFELSPVGGGAYSLATLVSFNSTNGSDPVGGLIRDSSGNFFGTTAGGGPSDNGTLFELSPVGGGGYNLATLLNFNFTNGRGPTGLTADSSGDLFGATSGGGTAAAGTVFAVNLALTDTTPSPNDLTAVEGISTGSQVLATFADTTPGATVADYAGTTVDFGSLVTTSSFTVQQVGPGSFQVVGSATYAHWGTYPLTVSIHNHGLTFLDTNTRVTVNQAPLTDTTPSPNVFGGAKGISTGSRVLASFTDPRPGTTAANYAGTTVNFGGSVSASTFTVVQVGPGSFQVVGSATYLNAGLYFVSVNVASDDGRGFFDSNTRFAVADAPLIDTTPSPNVLTASRGNPSGYRVLATFTDASPGLTVNNFAGTTVDFGGPVSASTFYLTPFGLNSYRVMGSATYVSTGTYTVTVTVKCDNGQTFSNTNTSFNVQDFDKIGVFRPGAGTWYLDEALVSYDPLTTQQITNFGTVGDIAVRGDWVGDGLVRIGVFRPATGQWFLSLTDTNYTPANTLQIDNFGQAGDIAVIGKWQGGAIDRIGIFRPSTGQWFLSTTNTNYTASNTLQIDNFGTVGDQATVGDWDGTGFTKVGVFRARTSQWFLSTTNTNYTAANTLQIDNFGTVGDQAAVGDWDHTGFTKIGVFRAGSSQWFLSKTNTNYTPANTLQIDNFGAVGDQAAVGDWLADGTTRIGVFRAGSGQWFLSKTNTNYMASNTLQIDNFGTAGDQAVTGTWQYGLP
ncbi:MAG: hypothetical protein K2R98_06285 [Gemmataceae bacterium]|nr:hypothetical protein [Gemmataceae bacterium]